MSNDTDGHGGAEWAMMANGQRMSLWRKIALGAGDFGFNLYWQMAAIYLLFFYTDVVGLSPATAGTIYMAALIVDAALDPLMGLLVDRTRSRFGRYRPYLLFGGVALALAYTLMFMAPGGGRFAVAYVAATHVLFRVVYAVISIPYASLFARVTRDAGVRTELTAFRMVCATLGAVAVAALTLPSVKVLGKAHPAQHGWTVLALVFGAVATALLLLAAWAAKGYDRADAGPASAAPPLWTSAGSLLKNRALILVLGGVMINSFCGTLFGKNLVYYFKYVIGKTDLAGPATAFPALLAMVCVPPWAWVARRIGKRDTWLWGAIFSLLGLLAWRLGDGSIPLLFGSLALQAVGTSSYVVSYWAMLPDTVEFGEWRTGIRTESMVFGLATLGQKAALGLGAGFLGVALSRIGYVPNAVQPAGTLEGIRQMMFWFPYGGVVLSALLASRYPVDLQVHRRIVGELAARGVAQRTSTASKASMCAAVTASSDGSTPQT